MDTISYTTARSLVSTEPQSASATPAVPSCPPAPEPDRSSFRRVSSTEEPIPCPIPGLDKGVLEMHVKEGSKIRNLLGFATARMQQADGEEAMAPRQVVFTGSGRGLTKTVTCAEILKRQLGGLHQLSKLYYKVVSEVWEGVEQHGGPRVTVRKTVPAIGILLSKDPLDPGEPGYQPPQPLQPPQPPQTPADLAEDGEKAGTPQAVQTTAHCSQHRLPDAKRVCLENRLPQTSSSD